MFKVIAGLIFTVALALCLYNEKFIEINEELEEIKKDEK